MRLTICGWELLSTRRSNAQGTVVDPSVAIPLEPTQPAVVDIASPPVDTGTPSTTNVPIRVPPQAVDPPPTTKFDYDTAFLPPKLDVPQVNTAPVEDINPQDAQKLRDKYSVVRILVIGKANSGKTTLIKKMCDTNEDPIVHQGEGRNREELPASVLKDPTAMRGEHDIHLEITYKSKPGWVFHDSRGFEAGAVDEVQIVKDFIKDRSQRTNLPSRLHMIWFCIPVDGTRVASPAELSFFNQDTAGVPVVLIFTKWDGQLLRACADLRAKGVPIQEALKQAPAIGKEILEEKFIPVFEKASHPPTAYTTVGDMQKEKTKCEELAEKTAAALNDRELIKLFVSLQTHNLELSMKYGISGALSIAARDGWSEPPKDISAVVLSYFGHVFLTDHDYSERRLEFAAAARGFRRAAAALFEPITIAAKQIFSSSSLQVLSIVPSAAIVATRSFAIKNAMQNSAEDAFKAAVDEYLTSAQYLAVNEAIKTQFHQYAEIPPVGLSNDTVKAISAELHTICWNNRLSAEK